MASKSDISTLLLVAAAGILAGALLCRVFSDVRARRALGDSESVVTVRDTVWREIHDTAFVEVKVERRVVRHDTVRLAAVDYNLKSPCDTATISKTERVDSVYVEVPVETRVFVGENYRITAEGYMVTLRDVQLTFPEVTARQTVTRTRSRHWSFGLGAQVGYGYTLHGCSPYAGLGATFGYVF
ncbi:MAG: hypothetical protein LUC18_00050 [Porphyromonadaceae bacterium]|nr:hypothetical protein [Porphyromonadaceae bacterium]